MNICPLHIADTQVSWVLLSLGFNLPKVVIFFICHLPSIPGHLPLHLVGTGPCRAVAGDIGTGGLIFMTPLRSIAIF